MKKFWLSIYIGYYAELFCLIKYLRIIKPKTQNAVLPASQATQHFGFWV